MIFNKTLPHAAPPSTVGCVTDRGMVRESNEDSVLVQCSGDGRWYLLVVCDGMGGHFGGKTASSTAVDVIAKTFFSQIGLHTPDQALKNSVVEANRAVWEKAQSDPQLNGMGTTAVVLVTDSCVAHVAHVGDSRCYRIRKNAMTRMTKDHSNVQRMVDAGMLTAEEARSHPSSNILYRCLGQSPTVDVDVQGHIQVLAGDRFLLCSDGLHGMAEDQIIGALTLMYSVKDAANKLVELAKSRGGNDNVSVILFQRTDGLPASGKFHPEKMRIYDSPDQESVATSKTSGWKFLGKAITLSALSTGLIIATLLYFRRSETIKEIDMNPVSAPTASASPFGLPPRSDPADLLSPLESQVKDATRTGMENQPPEKTPDVNAPTDKRASPDGK